MLKDPRAMQSTRYKILLTLFTLGALMSCAPMKPYRTVLQECEIDLSQSRPDDACTGTSSYRIRSGSSKATVAVVEFDDQGYLMRPELYKSTMDKLKQVHDRSGAFVVLFAHGWKHNASANDTNLVNFEKMLIKIHDGDQVVCSGRQCEGRETIGVFLAWRGLSATTWPFKQLSFWNRKKRAQRVGQDGAIRLIADIDTINTRHKPPHVEKSRDVNKLVLMGHSFGAAVIYTGTRQRMAADMSRPNERGTVSRTIADLIVLTNPAFEAARFETIHQSAADMQFPDTQKPILAVFTSEEDKATKTAFPMGRGLSTLFTKYNPDYPDQARENTSALGHYEPYWTHRLDVADQADRGKDLEDAICDWQLFKEGEQHTWNTGSATLERLENMQREGQVSNPYYIVSVAEQIIPNHGEIWGEEFVDTLFKLVVAQEARRCS